MRRILVWAIGGGLILGGCACALAGELAADSKDEKPEEPILRVDWRTDLDAALREAASWNRVILIYFHADWSQPCRWVDRGSFGNKKMAAYIARHFIPVRVDDTESTGPISRKYEIRVYPTVLFVSPAAEPLHIVLGPRTARQLYEIMEKVRALPGLMAAQTRAADDVQANFALGSAFATLNQLVRAGPYLKKVVELDPENKHGRLSQARLILAVVPLERGDSAGALQNINQYLDEFKGTAEVPVAIYYKGTILFRDGKLEEARKVFERLQKEFPKHRQTYLADKAIEAIDARLRPKEDAAKEKKPQPEAEKPGPKG